MVCPDQTSKRKPRSERAIRAAMEDCTDLVAKAFRDRFISCLVTFSSARLTTMPHQLCNPFL